MTAIRAAILMGIESHLFWGLGPAIGDPDLRSPSKMMGDVATKTWEVVNNVLYFVTIFYYLIFEELVGFEF